MLNEIQFLAIKMAIELLGVLNTLREIFVY